MKRIMHVIVTVIDGLLMGIAVVVVSGYELIVRLLSPQRWERSWGDEDEGE
jgi:uncharacterized membrane protein YqhA